MKMTRAPPRLHPFQPVKHGHVGRVRDWPYSSFHRMVRLGFYPEDWAGKAGDEGSGFGER
jgi:putative transposase